MHRKSRTSDEMVSNKVLCSTPEPHNIDSPSRDSDSLYDSDSASPVPFLCTQDGAEGETDVVWNFYTPKADNAPNSRVKRATPVSRRSKRNIKPKVIEKVIPKRRPPKATQMKSELYQELLEFNQNLHEIIGKKKQQCEKEKPQSGSEEDIFSNSPEHSPKSGLKTNSRCLRKNLLSSKFNKPEAEAALESDDSMNECLLKASQIVEENILQQPKNEAQHQINDSFDNIVGNLNDSALERLTQMPVLNDTISRKRTRTADISNWTVNELTIHDGSPLSKSLFGRHNSMPESPTVDPTKPSTSGNVFGRHQSMPYQNEPEQGDSPIRCTPDEIKKKHQLAREKLLAKRQLPFTSSQQRNELPSTQRDKPFKKTQFQPKVASSVLMSNIVREESIKLNAPKLESDKKQICMDILKKKNDIVDSNNSSNNNLVKPPLFLNPPKQKSNNNGDLKHLIEKKRQEALLKLRRRQAQQKT